MVKHRSEAESQPHIPGHNTSRLKAAIPDPHSACPEYGLPVMVGLKANANRMVSTELMELRI